jgi:hypothetical protein
MATVTVTKQFKDDFDVWADDRLRYKVFTPEDMAEFKQLLRKDMTPGPDQLREGLTFITAAGVEVPAMIDNVDDRIKCWTDYFAVCAGEIRARSRIAA